MNFHVQVVTNSYKWKEKHILMDIQIIISFVAVAVAGFGLYYDFRFPYPASSSVSHTGSNFSTALFRFVPPVASLTLS
jgi:hypothetical protein